MSLDLVKPKHYRKAPIQSPACPVGDLRHSWTGHSATEVLGGNVTSETWQTCSKCGVEYCEECRGACKPSHRPMKPLCDTTMTPRNPAHLCCCVKRTDRWVRATPLRLEWAQGASTATTWAPVTEPKK